MTQRPSNIIWGALVVILIAIIGYMYVDKRDSEKEYSQEISQTNTDQNKLGNNETPTEPVKIEDSDDWETYKDEKYNFQLDMKSGTNVIKRNYEEDNDKGTHPTISFDGSKGKFDVSIWTDWTKGLDSFTYLDFPATREGKLDGQPAHIVEAPRGYCDITCTEPFIAYSANGKFGVINLVFYGNTNIDETEQHIVDSFKFTSNETAEWLQFTNNTGGYSFIYPPTWKASINKNNSQGALFGVNATSTSGMGGVEIGKWSGSLKAYLDDQEKNAEVEYLTREDIKVNGIPAIRTEYKGFPVSGYAVLLKKGDQVFNIYINSKKVSDVALFDKLVNSFELK